MGRLISACLTVLALLAPASAHGAVVFGADLTQSVAGAGTCGASAGQPCSFFGETTAAGVPETGSPVAGVIVSVRIRHYNTLPVQVAVRTLRATSTAGQYLNVGPEIPRIVPPAATSTGEVTELPFQKTVVAGDRLGIGFTKPSYSFLFLAGGAPRVCRFRQGAGTEHAVDTAAAYGTVGCAYELLISGSVEPDADADGYGDESQDACPSDPSTPGPCPAPPGPDAVAPKAELSGPRAQDAVAKRRVLVFAKSNEAGTLAASGTIAVPGASRVLKLRPASQPAAANTLERLELRLDRKVVRRVRRALRRGAKLRARIKVVARDSAGNAASAQRTVKLRRRR